MLWGTTIENADVDALRAGLIEVLVHDVLERLYSDRWEPCPRDELERALGELAGAFMLFEIGLWSGAPRGQA